MNSPLRAISEMKADVAEIAPRLLSHGDAKTAAAPGDAISLGVPAASCALDDIVAARMKDLAGRLSAGKALRQAANLDAPLETSDVEIQPVSLAGITALRRQTMADADADDDNWLPTPPTTVVAPAEASKPAEAHASEPPSPPPTMSTRTTETVSERNLQSLLAVLDRPTPLRIAGEVQSNQLVPADTSDAPPATSADASTNPVVITTADDTPTQPMGLSGTSDLTPSTLPALAADEPLLLADQSGDDIRLVDLIKRQQSLLDQLNRYPPAPAAADAPADPPAGPAPPPSWSVVDQLAPALPVVSPEQKRVISTEAPPPLPSIGNLRFSDPSPDDGEPLAPERAPMIIERALAERSGRHGSTKASSSPSPLPAFAAGVAIAFAIAGSLLFVL